MELLLGSTAQALTLGDLVVRSHPGQPLRAAIPLQLQPGEPLSQVRVTLADAEGYAARHLQREAFLDGMRIALLSKGEGRARIEFYGEQPWQGEEAELLLQVVWPQGQISQRFHLAAVTPTESQTEATPLYVEVGENETLDSIAIRLSRGSNRSYLHMMYALFKANPDAFYRGNMNNLKHGAKLRVPTEAELYQLSDAEVFRGIREQYADWQQQRGSQDTVSEAGAALAGITDEQAAALARSKTPEALQQQLQRLNQENEAIQQRNLELKARLARLEQQMQQMTEQVLDYPDTQATHPSDAVPSGKVDTPQSEKEKVSPADKPAEGLPDAVLALVMVLVAGAVFFIWRHAVRLRRGGA